jgi:uncharacterized membrane protein
MSATLRLVLFGSLALNMFLLGAGAVTLGRLGGHDRPHGGFFGQPREFPGPGMLLRALPGDERAKLENELKPKRQTMREELTAARQARREALAAFSDSNYSATTMEARLKTMREADVRAVGAVHDVLAGVIDELSPEDRVVILQALREHMPPDGDPGMRDGEHPDGPHPDGPPPPADGSP